MNHTFYRHKGMKNGMRMFDNILIRTIIALLFFILFTLFVLVTGEASQTVIEKPKAEYIVILLAGIFSTTACAYIFLTIWENIFKSEDHIK